MNDTIRCSVFAETWLVELHEAARRLDALSFVYSAALVLDVTQQFAHIC